MLGHILHKHRIRKAVKKWNKDCGTWTRESGDFFSWGQLVWQEIAMWIHMGEKDRPKKEMDLICDRRGFTREQRDYLIEMMSYLGMYK